jgi:hypothetical protein
VTSSAIRAHLVLPENSMNKIIIFDFEVFRYDVLLGAYELPEKVFFQTWDKDAIKEYYLQHKEDIWVGHNNYRYDNYILEAVLNGEDPYVMSKQIISNRSMPRCNLDLVTYDLMNSILHPFSLKLTEMLIGKNIHTTEVDFNLARALTPDERALTEDYNKDDLRQTAYNFDKFYDKFKLRLDIISEFKLPLKENLVCTGTSLAANVLKAKHDYSLEYKPIHPKIYDTLRLKDESVKSFFLNEDFRAGKTLTMKICNSEAKIAAGGMHSTMKKYHCDKALYMDVSGYYNLVMLNYDLLPRTLPPEGKQMYDYMYHEQLRLKKINPVKRKMYKTILLSVFGAMNNEHTDFYDPWKALLVTSTGEVFLYDLLEKLDGLGTAFNINTDGIMFEPFNWSDETKIKGIVDEWMQRTGFVIKFGYIYNMWQRDVNCYVYTEEDGSIETKGEALKNYDTSDKAYASASLFACKEPPIIAKGIVSALISGQSPEEFVEANKRDLTLFQYSCKKNTFDYLTYDVALGDQSTSQERIDSPARVFAWNSTEMNGMIYKHKDIVGGGKTEKVSNLPPSVFVWNTEIMSDDAYSEISKKIDYNYYVTRIYDRIGEFVL